MNLDTYLQSYVDLINQTLSNLIPKNKHPHEILFQAASYSLLGSGKRIRPLLTLATVQTLKGNIEHALQPACAIEMIHTYSLIHDDLPCMDNDDFRRGKPSLHKVYPEGHALLTGDFLLTQAFETLAHSPYLSSSQRLELIATLAGYAGGNGMVGGQVIDLQASVKPIEFETLQLMHRMKTGGLITASVEFGGIIAMAESHHQEILKDFGQCIGLAFQIVDDILDHSQNHAHPQQDYVSFLGLEGSQNAARESLEKAETALNLLPYDTHLLKELARYIVNRDR